MPACLTCTKDFPAATRGGRAQTFCSPPCRVAAANARRATTRAGRKVANPKAGKTSTPPLSAAPVKPHPTVDTSPSDAQRARISALMTLAHSRGGIDPWQIAELAKLRGISPWAPLRVILGHKDGMK